MIKSLPLLLIQQLMLFTALSLVALSALAQDTNVSVAPATEAVSQTSKKEVTTLERLQYIQTVLTQKLQERSSLGEQIEAANEQDRNDLRQLADEVTTDIEQLRNTLESIAIGGVDTSLFVPQETDKPASWREDIALIAQPVIESLKDLTEKPRRLKELNDTITLRQHEFTIANKALVNLEQSLAHKPVGDLGESLTRLAHLWRNRGDDAQTAIDIAHIQIAETRGDKSLTENIFDALLGFITGRGLTMALGVLAALAVWFGVRFLLRGYRASLVDNPVAQSRTRYRLAAYSVHALTFVLILIAVFVVFYERGDVLLLGLLILLIVGLALGIRHLLPRYLSEARLLLNIGSMRETERIQYLNLPWRVESINMYTVLRNPELHGVLRIPLAKLHGVTSRPAGQDQWFPTSRGDVILLPDETLLKVIDQNPDTVELRERGGQIISVPTTVFYSREMTNLTRSGSFAVSSTFGIDYQHQDISLTRVPKILRDAIRDALSQSDLAGFIRNVRVELQEANSSSLDYWLFVRCNSKAAKSYLRIKRIVQSACIEACSRESLNIPFTHLTIVQKPTPYGAILSESTSDTSVIHTTEQTQN